MSVITDIKAHNAYHNRHGSVAEWLIAAHSKCVKSKGFVGSNPTTSAIFNLLLN